MYHLIMYLLSRGADRATRRSQELLDECEDGNDAWRIGAFIFMICGAFWLLLGLIEALQHTYCFLAFGVIHILFGLLVLLLLAKSRRFRAWSMKDFENDKTNSTPVKLFQAFVVCTIYIGLLVACAKIFGI